MAILTAAPGEVAQLAAANNLGECRAAFPAAKKVRLIWGVGTLSVTFAGLVAAVALALLNQDESAGGPLTPAQVLPWAAPLVVIFLAPLVWVLLTSPMLSARARQKQYFAYERGFVRGTGTGYEAIRYDQIHTVYQNIVRKIVNGIDTGVQYQYKLMFADGRQIKLNNFTTDMRNFGPMLQEGTTAGLLPGALAAVNGGQTLTFGPFSIARGGISAKGKNLVAWQEMKVKVENGSVVLTENGRRWAYARIECRKVPNLYVMLGLIARLRG